MKKKILIKVVKSNFFVKTKNNEMKFLILVVFRLFVNNPVNFVKLFADFIPSVNEPSGVLSSLKPRFQFREKQSFVRVALLR